MYAFLILLALRMMEVVLVNGAINRHLQTSSQIVTTNKPTFKLFTVRTHFLSPNQQRQSTEAPFTLLSTFLLYCLPGLSYISHRILIKMQAFLSIFQHLFTRINDTLMTSQHPASAISEAVLWKTLGSDLTRSNHWKNRS